jgi:transposase
MLDHRTMLAGILWIVGRGASWRELPDTFGLWNTVYSRYRRWRREGIWQQILEVLNVTTPTEVA